MSYLKILGLATVAAAALTAFVGAGTASATELTCKSSSGVVEMCGASTAISASAEGTVTFHPSIGTITCSSSSLSATTSSTGSASTTVEGPVSVLSFGPSCNGTVTVISKGSLSVHTKSTSADNSGTLTSAGMELTIEMFGFHCVLSTESGRAIGTITGSANTSTATLDLEGSFEVVSGSFFCDTTVQWTGSYKISIPDYLAVD